MGAIRLGKILLRWCDSCDLPLVEEGNCGICGSTGRQVEMTPPGDPRPAFETDIERIRKLIDDQFGEGCGLLAIPEGSIVLLNKVPALDRMDEVIVGGEVVGALRYDMDRRWRFIMRMVSASAIQAKAKKGTVVADAGAVGPIVSGKNLLAPGVVKVSQGIEPGDEIVILDPEGRAIATGSARMSSSQMVDAEKGVSIKTRWTSEPADAPVKRGKATWEDVVEANGPMMEARIEEAVRFVKRTMERNPIPAVVSFSGGKDSLACALIAMDAGLRLPLLFIDTTLEFPETTEYVREFARNNGLELITGSASEDIFMDSVERFGPPGRDFRWCCKTNKLGPTVRTITERFPDGVLSFIGQRRYESESRSEKPRVWKNPWVPGQVGAAPIQHWTSMHVWTYIFTRKAEFNPWYERGMDRIGCYLCPASDLGEQDGIESMSEDFRGWKDALTAFSERRGLPQEWVEYGLWRWRRVPGSIRQELDRYGIRLEKKKLIRPDGIELRMGSIVEMEGRFSAKGKLSPMPSADLIGNLLNMIGEVDHSGDRINIGGISMTGEDVIVESVDEKGVRRSSEELLKIVKKASGCVGCGLCLGNCGSGALRLEGGRVRVAEELCIHCGDCIEPCPALTFSEADYDF